MKNVKFLLLLSVLLCSRFSQCEPDSFADIEGDTEPHTGTYNNNDDDNRDINININEKNVDDIVNSNDDEEELPGSVPSIRFSADDSSFDEDLVRQGQEKLRVFRPNGISNDKNDNTENNSNDNDIDAADDIIEQRQMKDITKSMVNRKNMRKARHKIDYVFEETDEEADPDKYDYAENEELGEHSGAWQDILPGQGIPFDADVRVDPDTGKRQWRVQVDPREKERAARQRVEMKRFSEKIAPRSPMDLEKDIRGHEIRSEKERIAEEARGEKGIRGMIKRRIAQAGGGGDGGDDGGDDGGNGSKKSSDDDGNAKGASTNSGPDGLDRDSVVHERLSVIYADSHPEAHKHIEDASSPIGKIKNSLRELMKISRKRNMEWKKAEIIEDLEPLLHDANVATDFCALGGHRDILHILRTPMEDNDSARNAAMRAILAATRNNPKATEKFIEGDPMHAVTHVLLDSRSTYRSKALAMACITSLMSQHRDMQEAFVKSGGPDLAIEILRSSYHVPHNDDGATTYGKSDSVEAMIDARRRVLVLIIEYLVDEPESAVSRHLVAPKWCASVPKLLIVNRLTSDIDFAEKTLQAMQAMLGSGFCAPEFYDQENYTGSLKSLVSKWRSAPEGEYVHELASLATSIIDRTKEARMHAEQ